MKRLLFILSAIPLTVAAIGQTLTLDDCRRLAVEHNARIKNAIEQNRIADDNLHMYKANYLPKIALSASYLYSNGSADLTIAGGYLPTFVPNLQTGGLDPNILMIGPDGTPIFKQYAYMPDTKMEFKVGSVFNAGVSATQPIYMGGKIRTSVKMAKIGKNITEQNIKKSEAEVIIGVDEAFFTCVKMDELLKSATKYKQVVTEFYRQMENGYSSGMKSKNDLLKVQVRLNEAELKVHKVQNGLRLARMNLSYHIGFQMSDNNFELKDQFETPIESRSDSTNIALRPEYTMLEEQIQLKKQNVAMAKSDFLPQIAAMASYSYTNGGKFNGSTLFAKPSFVGGVSVSFPIINWGEGRRKVSAAQREVEIARNQFEDMAAQMELELTQASNNYQEAIMEVELTTKALIQANENMTESGNRYTAGMETLGDYLESQAIWQKAQSDLIEAKSNQRITYAKYVKAAGMNQQIQDM